MTWHAPTPEQEQATALRDRDLFCEAGAGSGKTRVLVDRYCEALLADGVRIDEILAFTFTERAAAELRRRIRQELGRRAELARGAGQDPQARRLRTLARDTEGAWVTTIHGFCRRLLAQHPAAAGLDPRFRVIEAGEASRLLAEAASTALRSLVAEGDDAVIRAAAAFQPWRLERTAMTYFGATRSRSAEPPMLPEVEAPYAIEDGEREPLHGDERRRALDVHAGVARTVERMSSVYADLKERRSGVDFADLEHRAIALLAEEGEGSSAAVRGAWRGRFRHVLVDEFQDTNEVQLALVETLRGEGTRVFFVGDENQSIYRFRGAELDVFRRERDAARRRDPDSVVGLRGNFRAQPDVLAAANELGRTLLPEFVELTAGLGPKGDGPRVELLLSYQGGTGATARKWADHAKALEPGEVGTPLVVAKARFVAERLRALVERGEARPGEIVMLLRAFTHVEAYREALERQGLDPYVLGGRGYWTQQQVEDLLRPLAVIANPLDDEMLFGALAGPGCQAAPATLWLLRRAAGRQPVWPVLEARFGDGGSEFKIPDPEPLEAIEDADRLREFVATVNGLRAEAALLPLPVLVERTMEAFRHDLAMLAVRGAEGRLANVRKLMRLAADHERSAGRDLRGFLDAAFAATEADEREGMAPVQPEEHDGVRIMTVHAAKGLEFEVVCIPDLDRGLSAGNQRSDLLVESGPPQDGRRMGLRVPAEASPSRKGWDLEPLTDEETEAVAAESLRLIYVAATRAQERLILAGTYTDADLQGGKGKPSESALRRWLPSFWEGGPLDGPERVELRAPAPALQGTPQSGPAQMEVRCSRPSHERACELARRREPTSERRDLVGPAGPPPILDGAPAPVPLGHLSYTALDSYERCGYRFYLERVIGVRAGLTPAGDPEGEAEPPPPSPALALGNAVHAALEWSGRARWERPDDERLAALLRREGREDPELLARARALLDGWLESELLADIREAEVRTEEPFALPIAGTVLRGSIDLLATHAEGPLVIDFKTDRLDGASAAERGGRYAAQRAIYALAAAAGEKGPIRTAHVFLEAPDEPVREVFDRPGLARARESLEALVERIRLGAFEPSDEPNSSLCVACPAAARLCPNPGWRPGVELAASVR